MAAFPLSGWFNKCTLMCNPECSDEIETEIAGITGRLFSGDSLFSEHSMVRFAAFFLE